MRKWSGLLLWMLALSAEANGRWEVMRESPAETIALEASSLDRVADRVSFRLRQVPRDAPLDASSQRPVREILLEHMVDCRSRRMATLSRAVFSDNDAMIHYQAVRPLKAEWALMPKDDPLLKRVCQSL